MPLGKPSKRPGIRVGCLWIAITSSSFLSGCEVGKILQCNQLAAIVNRTDPSLVKFDTTLAQAAAAPPPVDSLADIQAIAYSYTASVDQVVAHIETLVLDLRATSLRDDTLDDLRDRYVDVIDQFRLALVDASSAMNAVEQVKSERELSQQMLASQEKLAIAVASIQTLTQTQDALITEFNTYCGVTPSPSEATAN